MSDDASGRTGGGADEREYLDAEGRSLAGLGRPEPPIDGSEIATLLGFLERQRATFAWKVGGLGADELRVTVAASAITLGGMLKHLARFEDDMAAEWVLGQGHRPPWDAIDWAVDQDWDWRPAADDPPASLYGGWRDAVARSRVVVSGVLADGAPERPAGLPGPT